MKKPKKYYTVFVDGKLWTNVVDDMNSTESWAWGGILFLSKKKAKDFADNLLRYDDYEGSEITIVEAICQPK